MARSKQLEADRTQIDREKSTLKAALESEPQLTEDRDDYTTVRRRTRDRAFRELVLEAYDETALFVAQLVAHPMRLPKLKPHISTHEAKTDETMSGTNLRSRKDLRSTDYIIGRLIPAGSGSPLTMDQHPRSTKARQVSRVQAFRWARNQSPRERYTGLRVSGC